MKRPPHRHLPLFEAMCEFGQPELVEEMLALRRKGYGGPIIATIPMSEGDRLEARYDDLCGQLKEGLVRQLHDGTLVAFGYDSRLAIDHPRVRIPADKWSVLSPDFATSSATMPGLSISGIVVAPADDAPRLSRVRLHIETAAKRVRLDSLALKLAPRSFELLALLAEAASQGDELAKKRDLEDRLFAGRAISEKALAQAIDKLKDEMIGSGVETARSLIENVRARGYRLRLSRSEIQMDG